MKQLLAILGSPHTNGSTAAMLKAAVQGAQQAGWAVNFIHLYQKNLAFCSGCRACMKTGICVQKDDLQEIAALLKNCDVVILSAPIYWANVPAVVKNLFDRLLGVAMEETSTFPKPRLSSNQKYLLFTACNTPFPFSWLCGQSKGALRSMNEFFKTSGMKCLGKVVYSNAKGKNNLPKSLDKKIKKFWH